MFSSVRFQFNLFESSRTLTSTSDDGFRVDVKHLTGAKLDVSNFYNIFSQSVKNGLEQSQIILFVNTKIEPCHSNVYSYQSSG